MAAAFRWVTRSTSISIASATAMKRLPLRALAALLVPKGPPGTMMGQSLWPLRPHPAGTLLQPPVVPLPAALVAETAAVPAHAAAPVDARAAAAAGAR